MNILNRYCCFLLVIFAGLMNHCLYAAQPDLVCDVKVSKRELCVHIYSNSKFKTIMMQDLQSMRYEITYKTSKDGSVKTLKSENQEKRHPALLYNYVFFPPLKDGVTVPTKCCEIKINLQDLDEDIDSIQILFWRFKAMASVFDPTESYDKIFEMSRWVSSEVNLRKK